MTGGQNRDEMKNTLQALLASRLNSDAVLSVGSAAEADVIVSGTYVVIGKIFSVDALAKSASGRTLTRVFVQGDNQDELIPAIGSLAEKLRVELAKRNNSTTSAPTTSLVTTTRSDIVKAETLRAAPAGDFVKPVDAVAAPTAGSWLSKRLAGAANLLATGRTLPNGNREILLAEERRIAYYHLGSEMKLVSEAELGNDFKIISLDTIELASGALDIYVTLLRGEELASQVWQVKGDNLVLVVKNIPWFFRSMNLAGGSKKLYVQSMGRDSDFFDSVSEAVRDGERITLGKPIKMPRFGNIYTFNQFRTAEGKIFTIVINQDGYLVVYDQELNELWRSNDKFGGSELSFQKLDLENVRTTGDKYRWIFMNMRILVSSKGDILVGKNDGFWVLGNARSYKKGSVYNFVWNGSSLEEKWHTRDTQNYMPDYNFDESRNELLILQTVQRPGITTSGASSLSIKKIE